MARNVKITPEQWDDIRSSGERNAVIAARLGISDWSVSRIRNGHIPRPDGTEKPAKPERRAKERKQTVKRARVAQPPKGGADDVVIPAKTYALIRAQVKVLLDLVGGKAEMTGKDLERADKKTVESSFDGDPDDWRSGTWHLKLKRTPPPQEPTLAVPEPKPEKPKAVRKPPGQKAPVRRGIAKKPEPGEAAEPPTAKEFDPDWRVAPGELLKEMIEEKGMNENRVMWATGLRLGAVRALLDGTGKLTLDVARRLVAGGFGPNAEFWVNAEREYRRPRGEE